MCVWHPPQWDHRQCLQFLCPPYLKVIPLSSKPEILFPVFFFPPILKCSKAFFKARQCTEGDRINWRMLPPLCHLSPFSAWISWKDLFRAYEVPCEALLLSLELEICSFVLWFCASSEDSQEVFLLSGVSPAPAVLAAEQCHVFSAPSKLWSMCFNEKC